MKTKKKVFNFTSITEYKALEQYFEKMAARGWMLKKANRYSFEFYRIEPQQLKFSINLFHYESENSYPNYNIDQELAYICEAAGWSLCASNYKYQIYCAYKNEDAIQMHTDSNEEYKVVRNMFFKTQFIFICFIALLNIIAVVGIEEYQHFKSPFHFTVAFSSDIITFFALTLVINAICWFSINKINANKDKPLKFLSLRAVVAKNILMLLCYVLIFTLNYYINIV